MVSGVASLTGRMCAYVFPARYVAGFVVFLRFVDIKCEADGRQSLQHAVSLSGVKQQVCGAKQQVCGTHDRGVNQARGTTSSVVTRVTRDDLVSLAGRAPMTRMTYL